jgi:galactose-1-phosphate uridylyltransferase
MLGGDVACTHQEELLTLSADYFEQHGTCYWADLSAKERELRDRYITQTGNVAWITSFSPQGTNEVLGILAGKRDLLELDDPDLTDLSEGFSAILRGYASMGLSTFNFSLYSGPLGTHNDSFCCLLRIISRQNVYENYRTDDYFLQKLLRNELILNTPENLASLLRTFFPEAAGAAKVS